MIAAYNIANLWLNLILCVACGFAALWTAKVTVARFRPICAMVALMQVVKVGGYVYLMAYPEQEAGWSELFRGVAVVERALLLAVFLVVGSFGWDREKAIRAAEARERQFFGDVD